MWKSVKDWARWLKRDVVALYIAAHDPRTPWYAKGIALVVAAYALSPIDLIPDFIPVLGYLDDLLLLPIGILIVVHLIPSHLMIEFRQAAESKPRPSSHWSVVAIIVAVWILAGLGALLWVSQRLV